MDESDTPRNISPLEAMAMCQSLTQSAGRANPQQVQAENQEPATAFIRWSWWSNRPNLDNVSPLEPVEHRPSNGIMATVELTEQPPKMAAMIIWFVGRAG